MRLIQLVDDKNWRGDLKNLAKVFEILGISPQAAREFHPDNIRAFNQVCEDRKNVDYYSIGAKKDGRVMTDILKDGFDILVNDEMGKQCDGLIQDIESRWGQYLMTFQNDHLEIIGFQPEHNPANVFNLVADNIRVSEIKNDE